MPERPSGTVTFLFTDIEGSTRLLNDLGREGYARALESHRTILREAVARYGGMEQGTEGDSFFVAFARPSDALAAVTDAQRALAEGLVRVRMGIHSGEALVTDEGFVGIDVHRAARIAAAAHGGQVLVSQATRTLTGDNFDLRDLGDHRLKDLTKPERLFQLGGEEFPPVWSLNQSNLPVQPTRLVGRERELARLLALLRRDEVRLVTLTGLGGSGKTRLALQAAAELADDFVDGVWFVDLSALRDPALVEPSIAKALGAAQDLAAHVRMRRMLVVVDNFEQLLAAVPFVSQLLVTAPQLKLLMTSRVPLRLRGEREVSLPPLQSEEAVALFLERAQSVRPDLEVGDDVEEICRRLDHLPLAVELAAARVKLLTPTQLLARLERRLPLLTGGARDLPERQRTLRATIDWSYELLDSEERALFAATAVFAGGFTIEAAEEICRSEIDVLTSLVEASLVRSLGGERFGLLDTIREYAAERLDNEPASEQVRERHLRFFLALAQRAEPELLAEDQAEWLGRLDADNENFRAAIEFARSTGQTDQILRFGAALWRFWLLHGHLREGFTILAEALEAAPAASTELRAGALPGAAALAASLALRTESKKYSEQSVALARAAGDERRLARSLNNLGNVYANEGDYRRAEQYIEEALTILRRLGDEWSVAVAMTNLALHAINQKRYDRGVTLAGAALTAFERLGHAEGTLNALIHLAQARLDLREDEEAVRLFSRALPLAVELGYHQNVAICLEGIARLGCPADLENAARLVGTADTLREALGAVEDPVDRARHDDLVDDLRELLGSTEFERLTSEGKALSLDDAAALALASAHAVH